MAQNITLLGANYSDVPAVDLPKTGGGTARFTDVTDTTAAASDVASGKYFYTASGVKTAGTASGGGGGAISIVDTPDAAGGTVRTITAVDISDTTAVAADVAQGKYFYTAAGVKTAGTASGGGGATQHTIHLEFSDSTDEDIDVYYDDSWVGSLITSTEPTTYGQKTIVEAQLDGTTWYEYTPIPLNTQLVDYAACLSNSAIGNDGSVISQEWYYASDYTAIDPSMTFSYRASLWHYIGFYTSNQTAISTIYVYTDGTQDPNDSNTGYGTLSGAKIPSNAAYVRLCGTGADSSHISLIRTA